MSIHAYGEFGRARVCFAYPGQAIPPELAVEFELLRITEREPDREWIARLERYLQIAARPRPWSILRVKPNMERRLVEVLRDAGLSVHCPMERYRPTRSWRSRTRPLMPGYVFIDLADDSALDTARANRAVIEVMCREGKPVKVAALVIGAFVLMEWAGAFDRTWDAPPPMRNKKRGRKPSHRWIKGQRVKVAEGPFAGFLAQIVTAERADRIETLVECFGRETPVTFDEEMLEAGAPVT